ncbi:cyclodeaminase/cyclohydrolase family protein [Anaerococcus sp. mt242]|uniref:cyclodeaminase/cyclohydrolase family protein n=1 Tax=Anaerococcus sp. mt242 TaxID=2661917 RepID=UPI0019311F66|nr:cyclodeaminase/cyclohydrolase family protein [Anaerococcus sp. mt242]MBM0046229.1 cyclodeaminase/cyclohydrolase family protein [Anaerococcus sp. mt242]
MKLIDMDLSTLINQTRKPEANPGGGAVLILSSNLAINLCLMMDKENFVGELENKASVSHETLLKISESYKTTMQEDVDNFNTLMDKIKSKNESENDYKIAAQPLLDMVENNLKALNEISFFLKNGKKSTLTDGQIANDMLYNAIISSFPTIKINLDKTNVKYDYEDKSERAKSLYQKNLDIIERRNK